MSIRLTDDGPGHYLASGLRLKAGGSALSFEATILDQGTVPESEHTPDARWVANTVHGVLFAPTLDGLCEQLDRHYRQEDAS